MYFIGKFIFWIYFHLFYRLKMTGIENIPKKGPIIICSNHISILDPLVLSSCIKRHIRFMAKSELFTNSFFAWVLKLLGAFPVNRGIADLRAYKNVISLLKDEQVIGIFIQGKRVASSDDSISAKSGAAMFALKCKVPVVPVAISTSYKLFSKINVNVGNCIYFENFYDIRINNELLNDVTDKIVNNLNSLL